MQCLFCASSSNEYPNLDQNIFLWRKGGSLKKYQHLIANCLLRSHTKNNMFLSPCVHACVRVCMHVCVCVCERDGVENYLFFNTNNICPYIFAKFGNKNTIF